jgi:eukaryotic-like serine/threonine-protein kinase
MRLNKQATTDAVVKVVGGTGNETVVFHSDRPAVPSDWSPDGRLLVVELLPRNSPTKGDVWIAPVSGSKKPFPFLASEFNERNASFSSDGKWVAYVSNESGREELYVVPFPGPGSKFQISAGGTVGGGFLGDREIIYGTPEGDAVVVEIEASSAGLEVGPPKVLFKVPPVSAISVTRDGKRFLLAVLPQGTAAPRVALVTSWTTGLEKK